MSLGGNQQLAREVASAIEEWIPSEAYDHESKFQNELQEYLDQRLNSGGDLMLGPDEDIVVEREHGTVNGDVVVNGTIGIEMKRNLSNSQTKKLRGQIEAYQKDYSHVIVVACGIDDMDGWRKLKNDYKNQMGMDLSQDTAPVKFIHKAKADYGTGSSTASYDKSITGGQNGSEVDELAKVIEEGVEGYQSLTGDGSMGSGEATVAVAKAVLVGGFFIALVGFIVVNFLL